MLDILDNKNMREHMKQLSKREKNFRLAEKMEKETQKELELRKKCFNDRDLIREERKRL